MAQSLFKLMLFVDSTKLRQPLLLISLFLFLLFHSLKVNEVSPADLISPISISHIYHLINHLLSLAPSFRKQRMSRLKVVLRPHFPLNRWVSMMIRLVIQEILMHQLLLLLRRYGCRMPVIPWILYGWWIAMLNHNYIIIFSADCIHVSYPD